jgi:uncharacterized protein YdeI (YjbR/CyaY-like superfamily)
MSVKDKRVDAYIEKSAPFAKPILQKLRELVHAACPDITETIKWGMPFFDYKGPVCQMAGFKGHCTFGFWKAALMKDAGELTLAQNASMGHLGRIESLKDIPAAAKMKSLIKEAVQLNEEGVKMPAKVTMTEKTVIATPDDLLAALKKNTKAFKVFESFAPSHRKEYNQWVLGAKTTATRERRIAQAIEWIAEGKGRNWKYE